MPDFNNIKLVIFDLDGTLTKSKSPIEPKMAELVVKLLVKTKVAVISGGGYPQFQTQFIKMLPMGGDNYTNLLLLPTSGTKMLSWKGEWREEYSETLSKLEREKIMNSLEGVLKSEYVKPDVIYGDLIEDRGSQITFSALGQKAPVEAKYAWDPSREKREKIAIALQKKIPEFDVRIGGATSIDITRKGVNKAYGIRKLEKILGLEADNIIFVGDALFYGGNDYPAKATGVNCVEGKGPEQTQEFIESFLSTKN